MTTITVLAGPWAGDCCTGDPAAAQLLQAWSDEIDHPGEVA